MHTHNNGEKWQMNPETQRLCAYSGIISMLMFFVGMLVMTFLPPLSPSLGIDEVATIYRDNATAIRAGAVLIIISSLFAIPFYAVISVQLRRIEGRARPVLAYTQMIAGAANIQFFILPGLLFAVASYRPERMPEITHALNDLAWIITILPWPITFVQALACGIAILRYQPDAVLFPRWVGFFNLWVAVLFIPGSLIPFFKTGPFAWDGLLAFWIPATMFGFWFVVMQMVILKAIRNEEQP